jgi:hypothetical protein
MFPQRGPMERDAPSPEQVVDSFVCISQSPQLRSPSTKWGKIYGHRPRSSSGRKGLLYDTAITAPVPCSLQNDTLHFGLGRRVPR